MKKLRTVSAALAVVALLISGLSGSARAQSSEPSEESEAAAKPPPAAPPAEPAPPAAVVPSARLTPPGTSIHLGVLVQPQFEMVGAPDAALNSKNLFLRRIGFIVGG